MTTRLASLDLGTNTFRLFIGEDCRSGPTKLLVKRVLVENRITRLGEGLQGSGPLRPQAVERALAALRAFRALMDEHGVVLHRAVGTSALRRATDSAGFIERVRAETGIRIEVIPGQDEARLTAAGVVWAVGDRGRRVVVFDIGGGSTEFSLLEGGRLVAARSLETGVVRLTEQFLSSDPPTETEMAALEANVAAHLAEVAELARQTFGTTQADALIGTAGTPTTLAAIELGLTRYDPELVNGYVLRREALEGLLARLVSLPAARRLDLPGLSPGREDVIPAGICIVLGAMLFFKASEVVVSDGGLLEGVLLDLCQDPAKGAKLSP